MPGYMHFVHFILSVFTCGLWIPIWVLHAMGYRATVGESRAKEPREIKRELYWQERDAGVRKSRWKEISDNLSQGRTPFKGR